MRGSTGKSLRNRSASNRNGEQKMCLSNVYREKVDDSNLLAKNVADIKIEDGKIYFTDIMGIRTMFDGTLQQIDLTENFIIVK